MSSAKGGRTSAAGDWLNALVLRDGKQMSVKYQLNLRRPLVPVLAGVDCVPSYFIVGGLVFVPLSIPFLEHAYGGAPGPLPTSSGSCNSLQTHSWQSRLFGLHRGQASSASSNGYALCICTSTRTPRMAL